MAVEAELEAAILAAHKTNDGFALAQLYHQASCLKRASGDAAAAGFLLTHAYVFALESNHPSTKELYQTLLAEGREQ